MTDIQAEGDISRRRRAHGQPTAGKRSGGGEWTGGRAAIRGRFATLGILGVFLLGACSGSGAGAEPAETVTATATVTAKPERISSQKGVTLKDAREAAEGAGYTVSVHGANKGGAEPSENWKVCFEGIGYGTVDYGAVEEGALCPKKDGGPLAWPKAPGVTGKTYAEAVKALTKSGLDEGRISADSAYKDVSLVQAEVEGDADGYTVCFQSLKAGADVKPGAEATLTLVEGGLCPSKKGTYQDKENDPSYTPPPPPSSSQRDSGSGGSTGGAGGSAEWNGQCELTSPAGNCYRAGQFCANRHVGMRTHDANGRIVYCKVRGDGQRWNYS
ncbi:hypothetical protein CUT44_08240 [Streptomyces carminius]|uniref:PASTA domain-containing protein n=1 Tax=Streptomyces carminius TaxID=2665496 RepID=A0A2M8M228_9ACTN|nr:PASTA domain-containing protein [Streptomyces carminius]PJE98248.1 hypothetical protein CUT44_08240 [Streptomyces carminius]